MRTTATLFFAVLATAGFAAARTCANCPTSIVTKSETLKLREQFQATEEEPRFCGYANGTSQTGCSYDDHGRLDLDLDGVCPTTTTTYTAASCIKLD